MGAAGMLTWQLLESYRAPRASVARSTRAARRFAWPAWLERLAGERLTPVRLYRLVAAIALTALVLLVIAGLDSPTEPAAAARP
jgi:hypothetical protein